MVSISLYKRMFLVFGVVWLCVSTAVPTAVAQDLEGQLDLLALWLPGTYTNTEQLKTQEHVEGEKKAFRMNLVVQPVNVDGLPGTSLLFLIDSDDDRLSRLSRYVVNFVRSIDEALIEPKGPKVPSRTDRPRREGVLTRVFLWEPDAMEEVPDSVDQSTLTEHNPSCRPNVIYDSGEFQSNWNTTACFHHTVPTLLMQRLDENSMVLWNMMTGPRFELIKSSR